MQHPFTNSQGFVHLITMLIPVKKVASTLDYFQKQKRGWLVSGPKSSKMGNEDCIPDAAGCPSSNKGVLGFKLLKNNKK